MNSLNNAQQSQIDQVNKPANFSKGLWLKLGLLTAVLICVYFETIISFIRTWSGRDDYSHGFLVPFITLYFIMARRERIWHLPVTPHLTAGFVLTLIGSLMLIMGNLASVVMVQQVSTIVIIPGLVLLLFGVKYFKALSLPLAYLVFMIPPIIDVVISRIHWPFQVFSAAVAEKVLKIFDIPVFRSINFLELPNITLEVANICSGVNYLVSIIAIGIPLAYFSQRDWLRRITLVLSAVIIGIITNPFRITLIGIWTHNGGEIVHGPLHIFQGLFVSMVGFLSLFLLAWVIKKSSLAVRRKTQEATIGRDQNKPVFPGRERLRQFNKVWLLAVSFLFLNGVILYLYNPLPVPLKSPLAGLPLKIGEWKGEDLKYPQKTFDIRGADSELNRLYRNASGREIKIYIGYFESQNQKKELIHYKLQRLYENTEEVALTVSTAVNIRINKAILNESTRKTLVLYWYDLNGRIVVDRYEAKLITAIHGLIHRRTNGAVIIVSSTLSGSGSDMLSDDETVFIRQVIDALKKHLPDLKDKVGPGQG